MLTLTINGTQAVIPDNTSIRLNRDNPYYEHSGDYTYEVTLPLRGCPQNQLIFGAIHHPTSALLPITKREYTFSLTTPGLTLTGKAVPTSVTDNEVKVQLLAGRSALNFDALALDGEKYIDELPLGYAYEELWNKAQTGTNIPTPEGIASLLYSSAVTPEEADRLMHGTSDETDCVLYPIYSEADGQFANRHDYSYYIYTTDSIIPDVSTGTRWVWYRDGYTLAIDPGGSLVQGPHTWDPVALRAHPIPFAKDLVLAPQPYLCFIVERILQALGYELSTSDNYLRSDPVLRMLFIANSRGSLHLTDALPHWTVREFFHELHRSYGLSLQIEGTRAFLRSRQEWSTRKAYHITAAGDDRQTDIDLDDDSRDSTAGNVAYAFSDTIDRALAIGTDTYPELTIVRTTQKELNNEFNKLDEAQALKSNHLFICTDTGNRYGIFADAQGLPKLGSVDTYGALLRDTDTDIDTELRIVPVSMSIEYPTRRCRYEFKGPLPDMPVADHLFTRTETHPKNVQSPGGDRDSYVIVPYMVTADTRDATSINPFSLADYIAGTENATASATDKKSILEVAVNWGDRTPYTFRPAGVQPNTDGSSYYGREFHYPIGVAYARDPDGNRPLRPISQTTFFEIKKPGTIAHQALTPDNLSVDTRVVRQIDIYDTSVTDPTATYIINGRRYACKRLELTLNTRGVKLPVRGYFYEMD